MLSDLSQDTYYRVELRAHNAIGFSIPTHAYLKTARGEGELLGDKNYVYSASFHESTSSSLRAQLNFNIFVIFAMTNFYFL